MDYNLKNLTRSTNVSLAEAMKSAKTALPDGRTVEAGLKREGEEGRIVYDVALLDSKQDLRHVYVDASTGDVVRIH